MVGFDMTNLIQLSLQRGLVRQIGRVLLLIEFGIEP